MRLPQYALVMAALLTTASVASATTITQTATQPTLNTDWSSNFTLNNFDTTLGTLTSVTATLSADWATSGTVRNTATGPNQFNFSENTIVSASGGPTELGGLVDNFVGTSVHYNLASGASGNYGPFSNTLSSTFNSTPANLADFENPGSFTINLSTLSGTAFTGGGGNASALLVTDADATITLVYTYTATDPVGTGVPEPASLALLSAGMLGLAGFARRRV